MNARPSRGERKPGGLTPRIARTVAPVTPAEVKAASWEALPTAPELETPPVPLFPDRPPSLGTR